MCQADLYCIYGLTLLSHWLLLFFFFLCDLCAPCWLYNRCKWCLNQETHSIINSNFFSMEKRLTNFVLSKLIISIHLMAMLYICIQQSFNLKNWLLAGLMQGIGLKKTVTLSHWVYDNFLERFITALVVCLGWRKRFSFWKIS